MGQFVHQGDDGGAPQDGVHVHLREGAVPVLDLLARDVFQAVQHHLGARAVVVFHERDHAVGAPLDTAVCLGEHGVGLADAGCGAEVDPELAACHVIPRSGSPCRAR